MSKKGWIRIYLVSSGALVFYAYHYHATIAYWWAWMDWLERFPGPVGW